MASNYTQHVQLPLWEPNDDFLREEFNEAHEKIDAVLGTIQTHIAVGSYVGKAGQSNGSLKQTIELGFTPRFVLVKSTSTSGSISSASEWTTGNLGMAIPGLPQKTTEDIVVLEIVENGFVAGGRYGSLNNKNTTFLYIAF